MAKLRVKFTFPPDQIKEPVIYEVGKRFEELRGGLLVVQLKTNGPAAHVRIVAAREAEPGDDRQARGADDPAGDDRSGRHGRHGGRRNDDGPNHT